MRKRLLKSGWTINPKPSKRRSVSNFKTFSSRPSYLSASHQGEAGSGGLAGGDLWFCDYGYDLSRPFTALKVWTVLKSVGTRTLGLTITDNCRQAARMASLVSERNSKGEEGVWPAFEVVSNVCCLRVRADINVKELAEKLQLEEVVARVGEHAKAVTHIQRDMYLDAVRDHRPAMPGMPPVSLFRVKVRTERGRPAECVGRRASRRLQG